MASRLLADHLCISKGGSQEKEWQIKKKEERSQSWSNEGHYALWTLKDLTRRSQVEQSDANENLHVLTR